MGSSCRASNPATSSAFIGLAAVRSGSEVNALHHAPALSLCSLSSPAVLSVSQFLSGNPRPDSRFFSRGLQPLQEPGKTKKGYARAKRGRRKPHPLAVVALWPPAASSSSSSGKRFNAHTCITHLTN